MEKSAALIYENRLKQKIQSFILLGSVLLLSGKFLAFFLTNSVGILTDAMESIVNVVAEMIGLYSLHFAAKPKDKEHPFGHGKIEQISASIEGILIIIAGGLIIFEGIQRLYEPAIIEKLDIGIWIIAGAGLINYLMGWYSIKQGKKYESMALIAGGKHLQSDTYSSIGLVIGLVLLYFTGIHWIDSALALIFGSIIVFTGLSILRNTVANLLDRADKKLLSTIIDTISKQRQPEWIDIHNFKIIKYGNFLYIDCDVTLPWYYNIAQGHASCDALKQSLISGYSDRISLSIHSDSCGEKYCKHCQVLSCEYRKETFENILPFDLDNITKTDEEMAE